MSKKLAEILLKDNFVTEAQWAEAQQVAKPGGYVRFFIERKILSEAKILQFLSRKFGIPSLDITKFGIRPEVIAMIPVDLARKSNLIPIQCNETTLVVAVCDPTFVPNIENIKFITKKNVEAVLTSYSAFDKAMGKYYGIDSNMGAAIESFKKEQLLDPNAEVAQLVEVHDIENDNSHQDAPVVKIVNSLLSESIRRGASDIHIEPYEKKFRCRMRIDGTLQEIAEIPREMRRSVVARLKVMSRMDIAETRVPQDGRIKLKMGHAEIDFRVNSMPTLFGEKMVLRLLSKGNLQLDLLKLGFEENQLKIFKKGIYLPNGLVLVTGPTGSGKTTTLYSALSELNQISENLSTAEDPVEYNLEGINQVQINKDVGLTFAAVLRALLRQDPDIILVGEIRDYETAEVAVQAALTGHLVLSTLHTNDAPSTITRLINMGLEPFLVTSSVNTILAQRLVRTICKGCKMVEKIPKAYLVKNGFSDEEAEKCVFSIGKGCEACSGSGYKGRLAIYEVLDFSKTIKEMVLRGESVMEVRTQAVKEGMKSLRMSALTKVKEGQTTLAEALTLTMEG